jgi:large conductance mechanosensitive channel
VVRHPFIVTGPSSSAHHDQNWHRPAGSLPAAPPPWRIEMIGEFRAFLLKTNALALAVGVIIGVALGSVVTSLVNDIIMPPIGAALGGVDFSSLVIKLKDATVDAAGKPVPEVDIRYGAFINTIISFIVIAFVVFLIARTFIKEEEAAPVKTCPFCKEPNSLDASKCRACASTI